MGCLQVSWLAAMGIKVRDPLLGACQADSKLSCVPSWVWCLCATEAAVAGVIGVTDRNGVCEWQAVELGMSGAILKMAVAASLLASSCMFLSCPSLHAPGGLLNSQSCPQKSDLPSSPSMNQIALAVVMWRAHQQGCPGWQRRPVTGRTDLDICSDLTGARCHGNQDELGWC